jgi:hypothetical protein
MKNKKYSLSIRKLGERASFYLPKTYRLKWAKIYYGNKEILIELLNEKLQTTKENLFQKIIIDKKRRRRIKLEHLENLRKLRKVRF